MLNEKQRRFIELYATLGDDGKAYSQAGYSCKNYSDAQRCGRRLRERPEIKEALRKFAEEYHNAKIADAQEIQERLTQILRRELKDQAVVVESIEKGVSEARIIERDADSKDIIKAGEVLARMQGAFNNDLNVTLSIPVFGGESELED